MARLPILGNDQQGTLLAPPADPRNAQLSNYTPTLSEKLSYWLARNWYGDTREGVSAANRLIDVGRSTVIGNVPFAAYDAGRAAASGRYREAALNSLAAVAPIATLARGAKAVTKVEGKTPRAVIRPDNVFRGHGDIDISIPNVPTKRYAVRMTGVSQLDDMIQSGLVRPKAGGYGKQQKATIYFGETDSLEPTIFAPAASEGRIRIVANSADIAGHKGPIPIDKLKHVFALRNGKEVDILPEVLRKNREFK